MPYIPVERRTLFGALEALRPKTAGDLNYCFTVLINRFLDNSGFNYAAINEAVGALECCKLEFYRRRPADYEDTKIKDNGDVY